MIIQTIEWFHSSYSPALSTRITKFCLWREAKFRSLKLTETFVTRTRFLSETRTLLVPATWEKLMRRISSGRATLYFVWLLLAFTWPGRCCCRFKAVCKWSPHSRRNCSYSMRRVSSEIAFRKIEFPAFQFIWSGNRDFFRSESILHVL